MQYFGYSVNIIFVIVALLLFQRIFLFHVQFVNGMNTSYVQIRNELASEQLIKVQFQVAMSERYRVQDRVIALKYIDTEEMIADILMKPLPKHRFEKLVAKLGKKTVK